MKRFTRTLIASALLSLAAAPAVYAADSTAPAAAASQAQASNRYLGVSIAPVPRALRAQLGNLLPTDQGLLVRQVMPGSPADKAGIQPFDVLLAFGDQKLFAPQQLVQLVHGSNDGEKITLQLIHEGARIPVEVTVGEQQSTVPPQSQTPTHRIPLQQPDPRRYRHPSPRAMQPLPPNAKNWEAFDAITLAKQEDGSYKASIQYLNNQGEKKRIEFTGSRSEIRDQVLRQDDLPEIERNQLLDVLTGRDDLLIPAFPMPQGFFMPRMFDQNPGF